MTKRNGVLVWPLLTIDLLLKWSFSTPQIDLHISCSSDQSAIGTMFPEDRGSRLMVLSELLSLWTLVV